MAHITQIMQNGAVFDVTEFDHTAQEIDDAVDAVLQDGGGLMKTPVYDPQGKATDIYQYVQDAIAGAGSGNSTVIVRDWTAASAGEGA